MSEKVPADGLIKSLKSLVTIEYVILLLSFVFALNIAIVQGLHQTIPQATWEWVQKNVSLLELLLFFCCFGLYMTGGAFLLVKVRRMVLALLAFLFQRSLNWINAGRESERTDHSVFILRSDVLRKANRDSDSHYAAVCRQHEEMLREVWRLSSDTTACLGLIIGDQLIDGQLSVTAFVYQTLVNVMPDQIAKIILGSVVYLLISIIWDAYRGEDHLIYCPGFPKEDNSALPKDKRLAS